MGKRTKIGKVVGATWDPEAKAIRFTMKFVNGMETHASCPAGYDSVSGMFIPSDQLQAKCRKFIGMVIYDNSGRINPQKMTKEDIRSLRFSISLSNMDIGVSTRDYKPDMNSFLSRL